MKNEKNKISIIVCVYNTEKYIKKCMESILNQTYKNIELILVDDCSCDNSLKIMNSFNDKRIKIIRNSQNKGLSYSRNIALENATGDYIGYIDSDDYIPENYYESLLNTITNEKVDVAICDINLVYENDNYSIRSVCGNTKNKTIDFINTGLAASACNKLFKKEVLENKFSEGKVNEDLAVVLPIIAKNKVAYNEEVCYNYIQRNNSIQNSKITDKRFDIFIGVDLTLERIKNVKNYDEIKDSIVYNQLIALFIYVFTKEKNIFKRRNWFKKFNNLSYKYNIMSNKFLKEFIINSGKKHQIYYKLLLKLTIKKCYFLASLLVSVYNILRKLLVKDIIPKNITIDDIREKAKFNSRQNKIIELSVVVPNYNYERFLYQRIYSILNQKVKINELIILDDCSKDNSRKRIDEIVEELKDYINIKKVYNQKNSGSAFKQWEKGFKLAKSEYVWIAEADDYCSPMFLKEVTKPLINNKNIIISYSDTSFIDGVGSVILNSIKGEIDIMKTGHWDNNFINSGKKEYENYAFLNCTIANVSSAIIKNDDYKEYFKISGKYKQAGDWLFYVNIMMNGDVSYINKQLNYYRVHGNNVSSVTKKEAHIKEIKNIHKYYEEKYGLNSKQKEEIQKRYDFLKKVWNLQK